LGWFERGQYDVVDTWVMDFGLVAAAAIALLGAWRSKGDRPRRFVLAAGVSSYALGYVVYHLFLTSTNLIFFTVSDYMWFAFYPAAAVFLGVAFRRQIRRSSWLWLDAAVNTLALVAVGWAFVVAPAVDAAITAEAVTIGQAGYMIGDLILAGMLVGIMTVVGLRAGRAWALPAVGVLILASADVVYTWQASVGIDVTGSVLDPMWVTAMVLFAVSCWLNPSRTAPLAQSSETPLRTAVSPLIALVTLVAVVFAASDPLAHALVLASVALVCARLGITLRANHRLMDVVRAAERASAEQARTDPLTTLGNRRALETELTARTLASDPFTLVWLDLNGFKSYNDRFGHSAGDALLRRMGLALALAAGPRGHTFRPGGDEFCVLLGGRVDRGDRLMDDVMGALTENGVGFSISPACGIVAIPDEAHDAESAQRLADERMYGDKRSGRKSPAEEMSELLSRVVAEREPALHEHANNVVNLAVAAARSLGCEGEELDVVARAAEQHDVGKLAIPDAILLKPGILDESEWDIVRQHTIVGERILAGTPALRPVARVVRSCHESWDGTGYPDGLVGREIPLAARIISVSDAYSAMISDRPYRRALSASAAVDELRRCAGTQFDPDVVEPFVRSLVGATDDASAYAAAT
jgi:diguanylate cyclase (GGDEF)-like protein